MSEINTDRGAVWMTSSEAGSVAPGLSASRLVRLRLQKKGPPATVLSDGEILYEEVSFRRWLESTVDFRWVYGLWGDHRRPAATADRRYTYATDTFATLRKRHYIDTHTLLQVVPEVAEWQLSQLRSCGVGPRFLTPTPRTIIYELHDAHWWFSQVPTYSARHETGYEKWVRRPLLTPPPMSER